MTRIIAFLREEGGSVAGHDTYSGSSNLRFASNVLSMALATCTKSKILAVCLTGRRARAVMFKSRILPLSLRDTYLKQGAQIYDLLHIAYAVTAKEGDEDSSV